MTFKHTEEGLGRPWFAQATWVGRVARASIFVLPPVLTLAFGVFAARHEAAVGMRDLGFFARSAAAAGGEAAEGVRKRKVEADRQSEESLLRLKRIDPDFRAAVATDNHCVRDAECMENGGIVRIAFPRRRHEELRRLLGGAHGADVRWNPPCGRRKESVPVCRKNACALEERFVVHPPCDARGYPIQKRVPPTSTSENSDL